MLKFDHGTIAFERQRCCQCGVCFAACRNNALRIRPNGEGFFDVACDLDACVGCGECVAVCPSSRLPAECIAESQVKGAIRISIAHARSKRVRWMASSGGVARTIIRETLLQNYADAVYSLIYPTGSGPFSETATDAHHELSTEYAAPTGWEVQGRWLTQAPRVERIPCSLYRPVPWGAGLADVKSDWRRAVLVGLPCQLKGAAVFLARYAPKVELLKVAIFCRQQKTLGYTQCIKRMVGRPDAATAMVYYRGGGWPGKGGIYESGRRHEVNFFFPAKCWTLPACHVCSDCLCAQAADVTLGDPWGLVRQKDDPLGANLVWVWTVRGHQLLEHLSGAIVSEPCPVSDALRCLDMRQVSAKLRATRYHLGTESSWRRRWRGFLAALATRIAETQLRVFPPNSLPIRLQLALRHLLVASVRWIAAFGGKRSQ